MDIEGFFVSILNNESVIKGLQKLSLMPYKILYFHTCIINFIFYLLYKNYIEKSTYMYSYVLKHFYIVKKYKFASSRIKKLGFLKPIYKNT